MPDETRRLNPAAFAALGSPAAHREYEVAQAALPGDGSTLEPGEAGTGGSGLRTDRATAQESAKDPLHYLAAYRRPALEVSGTLDQNPVREGSTQV